MGNVLNADELATLENIQTQVVDFEKEYDSLYSIKIHCTCANGPTNCNGNHP